MTPYRGRPVESPWWRTAPNPAYLEGESFARARDAAARLQGDSYIRRAEESPDDSLADRVTREAIWRWVTPRWRRHLERLVERERPDAVVVFTVRWRTSAASRAAARPLRHPGRLLRRRRADEPARVRRHGHGLQLLPRRRSGRVRPRVSNSEGGARAPARARRAPRRGRLLGRRPRVLRAAAGREGERRLLLRLRRQVPPRVDGGAGRRARRARCPTSTSRSAATTSTATPASPGIVGDVPFNRLPARDLGGAGQPLHHAPLARDRLRVLVVPPVRARRRRRRDRREPVRGDRALVRAGQRAARRPRRRRGDRRLPRRCSTTRRRRRSSAAARASACSTSTPTATARAGCSSCVGLGVAAPVSTELARGAAAGHAGAPLAALRRIAIVPAYNEERNIGRVSTSCAPSTPARGRRRLRRLGRPHGRGRRRSAARTSSGCPFNLGIGGAVQTGFRYAWEGGYELAVRLDGDGQHDPAQLRARDRAGARRRGRHRRRLPLHRRRRLPLLGLAARRDPRARVGRLAGSRASGVTDTDLGLPGAQPRARSGSSPPTTRTTTRRWRGW